MLQTTDGCATAYTRTLSSHVRVKTRKLVAIVKHFNLKPPDIVPVVLCFNYDLWDP